MKKNKCYTINACFDEGRGECLFYTTHGKSLMRKACFLSDPCYQKLRICRNIEAINNSNNIDNIEIKVNGKHPKYLKEFLQWCKGRKDTAGMSLEKAIRVYTQTLRRRGRIDEG